MASKEKPHQQPSEKKEAAPHASKRREEDGPSGVRKSVEMAARVYYDFCKKAARTISRLKRED